MTENIILKEIKIPKEGKKKSWEEIKFICNKYKLTFENIGGFLLEEGNNHIPEYLDFVTYPESKSLYAYEHMETGYKTLKNFYGYEKGFIFTPDNPESLVVLVSPGKWTSFSNDMINKLIEQGIIEKVELNCKDYKKYVGGFFRQEDYEEDFDRAE